MISFENALNKLAGAVKPLRPVNLKLEEANGLRLDEALYSDIDSPHWDVSAMDGYAVYHNDLLKDEPLHCSMTISAGDKPEALTSGKTARIFTGAVMPEGADTVIEQERAVVKADKMVKLEILPRGSNVRCRGEVLHNGDIIANPGELLTPWRISALASCGVRNVKVIPRPKIALIMTGSELVTADMKPVTGAIRDSNGPMLRSLIVRSGFELASDVTVADDLSKLTEAVRKAVQIADLVLTSGGVSVGDRDFVPKAVGSVGGETVFHKVAMKPGKPFLAARFNSAWLMGLPGNPVSVLVCWRLFALPLCLSLSGDLNTFEEKPSQGRLGMSFRNSSKRKLFLPVRVSENGIISNLEWKGSHDILTMSRSNALAVIEGRQELQNSDKIPYFLL